MTEQEQSAVHRAGLMAITLASIAVGLWVAIEYVGVYPSINHCPQSETFVCPSQNIRNIIPAAVGSIVAVVVLTPLLYGYNRILIA